ncbi:MAG: LpqN/LpqT family lipoprotein [Cellulomonadaceae bacterium]
MAAELSFPSEQFPDLVHLTMSIPDGWEPVTAVGVHLGARQPMPAGQFTPNVVVEVSRLGGAYTLAQAVDLAQRNAQKVKRYRFTRREEITVAGATGYVIDGELPQPRGGSLLQTVRLAVIERGPVVDLVQVTGTCAKSQPGAWEAVSAVADSLVRTA